MRKMSGGGGGAALHHNHHRRAMREKAKNQVDDLQAMFAGLQSARREGRGADAAVLEEQLHQLLREWKTELSEPSPAASACSSFLVCVLPLSLFTSFGHSRGPSDLSSYIRRMLQLNEEEEDDDATSKLTVLPPKDEPLEVLGPYPVGLQSDLAPRLCEFGPATCPPPSAFLRPKCALWDCPRPARGSEWFQDYCSSFHATLALNEGPPGMSPVLRPGGIDLKDGPLFAALIAKSQGKNVGIPECEGAATNRSPWNAPELFDLLVLNGESLREWLFFDKPRRAFESGNRKQRSLPDYSGRGWHESRKQVMKEFGGLKRSYYMDPQPLSHYEWHLYEYEINDCDACALYRLELKLVDPKKSAKAKLC
ncbi:hypothetical protein B296_00004860 [Ensete ventricosum]|uniref:Transcription factor VOZ1 n=1 Tax=Ensete ventricosum TaxID=4639 RepID=A0A427AYK3_ENSVE|nr:hypothetical protein B296_00004860 [Ensete ventricosum]